LHRGHSTQWSVAGYSSPRCLAETSPKPAPTVRILLVGGIFGKPAEYRRLMTHTPETVLAQGLRARGHEVVEHGQMPPFALHGHDVAHVHHLAAGAVAAVAASPPIRVAFTGHDFRPGTPSRRAAMRYVMRRADAVVALSRVEALRQQDELRAVKSHQYVIPNGIDATLFRFAPAQMPGTNEPWRLLFVGQLERLKGVVFLLRALTLLDPALSVQLDLVYQVDTEEETLSSEVERLGLERVHFLGARSSSELAQLYACSHLLVIPSTREALPSVVSEAMLVGRPVVGTNVGGIGEQVGEYGEVVPPRDPVALAAAISRVLKGYARYARIAQEISDAALRRYSIHAMVTAHERMYEKMMEFQPAPKLLGGAPDALTRLGLRAFTRARGGA
jgi:D-inositol-3-phosphate glycosyltransferase